MLKLSVAVLVLVGVVSANPLQGTIKGYGLVSPISKHKSAVAGAIPQNAPAPSYGFPSTKGGKTNFPIPKARPAVKVGPVTAAVITSRAQEVINVPISEDIVTPQVVIIEPNLTPVTIEFRSRSSPVNIQQVHIPGPKGQTKTTKSQEAPDRVIHEVVKPVIQEVREIIQPFRKITQQILPVQEEVLSVVSKGERKQTIEEASVPKVEIPEEPEGPEVQQDDQPDATAESAPGAAIADSETVVQAGLIGGARVSPANPDDAAALLGTANNRPFKGVKSA